METPRAWRPLLLQTILPSMPPNPGADPAATTPGTCSHLCRLGEPAVCLLGKRVQGRHLDLAVAPSGGAGTSARLDEGILAHVTEKTTAVGRDPSAWLHQLLRARAAREAAA